MVEFYLKGWRLSCNLTDHVPKPLDSAINSTSRDDDEDDSVLCR